MAISGQHVIIKMQDKDGIERTFADGDIISVDVDLRYRTFEATAGADTVANYRPTIMEAPLQISGYITTTAEIGTHTVLHGLFSTREATSVKIQVGQGGAPQSGDMEFTGTYFVESYQPRFQTSDVVRFAARLVPHANTTPDWGQVA